MTLFADLLDLLLPPSCACCGRSGQPWCQPCQPATRPALVRGAAGPPVYAAGEYADQLRLALLAYKERNRRQLAPRLADYLVGAVEGARRPLPADRQPVLVPVPSRRSAARLRGGDHLLRLATLTGRLTGLPVVTALRLRAPVRDSAGLTAEQRQQNLAGRLLAAPPSSGRLAAIVLDDIVTTGATLTEAERALTAAGWPVVTGAVIAATRLRHPASIVGADRRRAGRAMPPGTQPERGLFQVDPWPFQLGRSPVKG